MRAWPGVVWSQADLLDIYAADEVMEGITEVYNCAAIVSFNPKRKAEILHNNTAITCNVVDAALDAGVRKLVHISSVAALGRTDSAKEITEEAQWEESNINSAYGMSKYSAEMEVWRAIGEGLDAAILNPGIIMGEHIMASGWGDGSAKLMQVAWDEFPFYTKGINAFVDIADVVNAAVMLMDSPITAERFILSAGNFSYQQIFTYMAEALGRKVPAIHAGPALTGLVWRWEAIKGRIGNTSPTITRETARNAQTKCFYRNNKLTEMLPGFSYTPMQETIKRMSKAYVADVKSAPAA
jgi:nucleoside-diphosphate-sugar epimerase